MAKIYGMNVLEFIEEMMDQGMSEEQASELASMELEAASY